MDQPDFIQRNGTWLLSLVGLISACFGTLLSYMLRSRCRTIKFCGFECDRDVLDLSTSNLQVPVQSVSVSANPTSPSQLRAVDLQSNV
jgi:hypothetical protein